MEITDVRITLRNEDRLKAYASVTFDNCFVVRGMKVISADNRYLVSMPSRKRPDGKFQDIAHPTNQEMRKKIEDKILEAYERELKMRGAGPGSLLGSTPSTQTGPQVPVEDPESYRSPE